MEPREHHFRFIQSRRYTEINDLLTFEAICREVRIGNKQYALDVGCGRANEWSRLSGLTDTAVGVDVRKPTRLPQRRVHFILADARYLPFKTPSFDFVLVKDLLHHIPRNNLKTVVEESCRVLKKKGTLKIVEANRYHMNSMIVWKEDKSHEHFSKTQIVSLPLNYDKLYGYELLPWLSKSKTAFLWNVFVYVLVFLTTWATTSRVLFALLKIKERYLGNLGLSYYIISKQKT